MRTIVLCFIVIAYAGPAFGGEVCSQMGGTCKAACGQNEQAESGAFLDCSDTEECCVTVSPPPGTERPSGATAGSSGDTGQSEQGTVR